MLESFSIDDSRLGLKTSGTIMMSSGVSSESKIHEDDKDAIEYPNSNLLLPLIKTSHSKSHDKTKILPFIHNDPFKQTTYACKHPAHSPIYSTANNRISLLNDGLPIIFCQNLSSPHNASDAKKL